MKKKLTLTFCILASMFQTAMAGTPEPDATYLFANKDGKELYLDIYNPSEGSETTIDGKTKPTVIFVFGGGFVRGERYNAKQAEWYGRMTKEGYRVVAIDYRLGLQVTSKPGPNPAFIKSFKHAVEIAVEDLFSATAFLIENAGQLGIDPSALVVCGSSAGAITAMQAEWYISNKVPAAAVLPAGFNYSGIMSFAGAIFSEQGSVKYDSAPCPTLMFHGTEDKIVNYNKIQVFKLCFAGSNPLAEVFAKGGYNYSIYRFSGRSHEIAGTMTHHMDEIVSFIEKNVMKKNNRIVDAVVNDPDIPSPDWARGDLNTLYNDK